LEKGNCSLFQDLNPGSSVPWPVTTPTVPAEGKLCKTPNEFNSGITEVCQMSFCPSHSVGLLYCCYSLVIILCC